MKHTGSSLWSKQDSRPWFFSMSSLKYGERCTGSGGHVILAILNEPDACGHAQSDFLQESHGCNREIISYDTPTHPFQKGSPSLNWEEYQSLTPSWYLKGFSSGEYESRVWLLSLGSDSFWTRGVWLQLANDSTLGRKNGSWNGNWARSRARWIHAGSSSSSNSVQVSWPSRPGNLDTI